LFWDETVLFGENNFKGYLERNARDDGKKQVMSRQVREEVKSTKISIASLKTLRVHRTKGTKMARFGTCLQLHSGWHEIRSGARTCMVVQDLIPIL
jgi:hypothetical protein